jgi:hypothetical protein
MEAIFKDDDRVYLNLVGWGTIIDVTDYDISVKFDTGDVRHISGDVRKLLSFTEYTLEGFSQERPEELPSRGDIVWVRDDDDEDWVITHYFDYEIHQDMPYVASMDMTRGSACHYAQMTTKNPYANEHN